MKARFHPLYGGRQLAQWIRAGGRPQRQVVCYFQRLRWHAHWFEHNWRAQTRALGANPLPEDPAFVLGLWRSGTTVLHELLAATCQWYTPQTWQCFHPSTCFQVEPPARDSCSNRPMDQGVIRARGPQEDEFALLLLGEPSVYRGFIDPRRLRECGQELWQSSAADLPRWQDFLRGGLHHAATHHLLLKSPSHTFRLPLLRALFPSARFVWLGRHIGEVLASNRRMWHEMTRRYALWDLPAQTLEGFLQDMLQAACGVLEQSLEEIPPERLLWVDFEDLRSDPRRVMRRITRFLDLEESIGSLDRALAQIPVHAGSRADLPADGQAQRLDCLMSEARRRFGGAATGADGPQRL